MMGAGVGAAVGAAGVAVGVAGSETGVATVEEAALPLKSNVGATTMVESPVLSTGAAAGASAAEGACDALTGGVGKVACDDTAGVAGGPAGDVGSCSGDVAAGASGTAEDGANEGGDETTTGAHTVGDG